MLLYTVLKRVPAILTACFLTLITLSLLASYHKVSEKEAMATQVNSMLNDFEREQIRELRRIADALERLERKMK